MDQTMHVKREKTEIFTVCNIAYLPRALVLAQSVLQHEGKRIKIVLFDRKTDISYPEGLADILWAEELGVPKFNELAFMYDIIEFSTSLKPFITLKLLQDSDAVVFLDPDTCLFRPLDPVYDDLAQHPIVLTPHHTSPQPSTETESDIAMMRFGSFNLGFFAVRNDQAAINFLQWWSTRCIDLCFMESQFGLSTDQKWVTIAPCLFPGIYISFNQGYNVAAWNTFERKITKAEHGGYLINEKYPLIFFHYSNFDGEDPEYLKKRASNEIGAHYPALLELGLWYRDVLREMTAKIAKVKYSFDFMSDGTYISPTLRKAYAAVRKELPENHDPFDAAGPVGGFARKNKLLEKKFKGYKYPLLKDAQRHSKKLSIVYFVLRMLLRVLGPNGFYDLSKLMVYLSSYRKNRQLWRL
jgi:hypothetical protein